jgi:KDO2-lipid IV(A) lauroyltransferase
MSSRNFRYRLEDLALRALIGLMSPLNLDQSSNFGAGLLRAVSPYLKKPNKAALENLTRVFSEEEAKRLLPAVWANLGRVAFEYPKLRSLANEAGRIEIRNPHHLTDAMKSGKGGIFIAAHLGNWELFPMVVDRLGGHIMLIYRAPNNPGTRDLLQELRPNRAVTYVPKSGQGMRQVLAHLSKGGLVGFLTDHRYNDALPVDFLGGRARLAPTAALLARRFGVPIVCTRMERVDGARFVSTFSDPILVEKGDSDEAALQAITQQIATRFEGWIKERPEQWFWMQKLWAKGDNP